MSFAVCPLSGAGRSVRSRKVTEMKWFYLIWGIMMTTASCIVAYALSSEGIGLREFWFAWTVVGVGMLCAFGFFHAASQEVR